MSISSESVRIVPATRNDIALIVTLIHELAEYEKLRDSVRVTGTMVEEALFGTRPAAEALIGYWHEEPVAFAVFFTNFSTFLGRAGLYLEDLFVRPAVRRNGIGRAMLKHLAQLCVQRGYARMEWAVLNWNQPASDFYKSLGASPLDDWTMFRLTGDALRDLAGVRI